MSQTAEFDLSKYEFFEVAGVDDLPAGERLFLEIDGKPIVVFNITGKLFAIGDVCTHDNNPLGEGELDGYQIICPRHGARFDVRDGRALRLPAVRPVPAYPVRVVGDVIKIGLPIDAS